jgi:hypothetical protein
VAMESSAGHLGWSTTATSFISSVKALASGLMVNAPAGTGTTQ